MSEIDENTELGKLRAQIDQVDSELVDLISRRASLATEVAEDNDSEHTKKQAAERSDSGFPGTYPRGQLRATKRRSPEVAADIVQL